ncbi:snRNA-activating protein complex subunit 4 isoform X2 [Rhinoraja longicauda]
MRFISLQMTQRQLLGNRFDDHDWIKISNIDFDGSRKAEDIKRVWQNSEHPSISQTHWSSEEIKQLNEISESAGYVDWESIASELQTARTAFSCLQKYQEFNKDLKRSVWSKKEDQMLTELVQKMRVGNFIPYTKIAYFMEGRNSKQIVYRWSKALDPTVTRGPWTPEEDELLLKAVAKYGSRDWYKIQEMVPGRMDSQCRDRYRNGLNQNVRKGKWTEKEVSDFKALVEKHGVGKWSKIAAEMSGRTDTQCLSKWKALAGLAAPRKRKRRRRIIKPWKRESTPEESSEDSENDNILEEMEQEEEEDEDHEFVPKVEPKKRQVKRKKPAEIIVLDVDRWVPVVEKEQPPAEENTASKGDNAAVEQHVANLKIESQTHRGRPRSSKIWRNIPKPTNATPGAGETAKSVSSASTVVPEPEPPPKLTQSLVATDEQQEPPRSQRNAKQSRRRMGAAKLSDTNLERRLLAEISRWTSARPVVQREIDVQRERLEATGLSSTPVFVLLLQVFRIDKEGCMQIIKDKMNKAAQSLPAIKSENQSRSGPYLNQVKGATINVGNGKTMEMARFKLSSAPAKAKPKTVQDLLAETRRARSLIKTSRLVSRPLVIPQPLTIQPPLQVVLMTQPVPSSEVPVSLESQVAEQSSIQTRSRTKPKTESMVRHAACGKPAAGTQQLLSEQPNGETNPGATPLPHSSQVGSSAIVEPTKNINALNAASVPPAKATCHARWLQPIAPAPPVQPVLQTNGMVVPLMLPNSTVPIMALVTPQGLLCLPPGTVVGLPNQNTQTPTSVTDANQTTTTVFTTVPQSGVGASTSLGSTIAPSQSEIGGPNVAPVQTTASVKLSSTQPLNTPPLAVCKLIPSTSNSVQIEQTQTLSSALAPSLTSTSAATTSTDLPAPEATKQVAANRIDGNDPTPLSTTQLAQGSGPSRVTVDVASTTSPWTQPGSVAPPEGTRQPATPSQSDKTSIDFTLLCEDKDPVTRDWLEGKGGIHVPGTQTSLPYLPPFAATLRGFSNLLLHKKVLEQNVLAHEAADVNEPIDPKIRLEAARVQVRERLQGSPAYQLLKARFLSAFTLPAFLATLPPEGTSTTSSSVNEDLDQDSSEECEYTETDIESEEDTEGLPEQCMMEEVTSSQPNQLFEIPADLSFDCDLLGSLETRPEDQNLPEPSNVPEVSVAPEGEVRMATRRSHRLRKNP